MHAPARGLSLVELLVGLAIGLLLSAAGVTLLAAQWREHRSQMAELRLMQELRGSVEMITRDLRRAGYSGDAAAGVWQSGASAPVANPYAAFAPSAAASNGASYAYSRDASENQRLDANEQFGLRLRNGAIELQLGAANWQALTDAGTLTVTAFSVTPTLRERTLLEHCARPCPAGASCAPRLQQRSLVVQIDARSVDDPRIERRLRSELRQRNDGVVGACPA